MEILPLKKESLAMIPQWTQQWMQTLNPNVFPLTIFSCSGYIPYILQQQSVPFHASGTYLLGAYNGAALTGFIEFTVTNKDLFINNICVNEQYRGRGIGTRLLDHVNEQALRHGYSKVRLECFSWNESVYQSYLALGYVKTGETFWSVGTNPVKDKPANHQYLVRDYPFAEVCQQAFGFSTFHLEKDGKTSRIGRIQSGYYRITLENEHLDEDLLQVLAALDPSRSLFVIQAISGLIEASFLRQISSSIQMELSLR
ncbi:MAG: GNAT family N-acetyltransferase [Gorillibacterium sp.]|nr:GNAT family N-acetyltransferase [Gorillibacterium sp.]